MGRERNRRMYFASAVGLGQRIAQIAASLITLPLALHVLGVSGFGVWGAATSLAWLVGMLDLGLGSALITLIPRSVASGRNDVVGSHIAAALVCGCALSVAIIGVGSALVLMAMDRSEANPFIVAVVGLALNVPLSIANSVWFGLQKGHVAGGWELVQTLLTLGLLMVAAACHGGVMSMVWAVYGALLLANFSSLVHLLLRHPEIRPRRLDSAPASLRMVIGKERRAVRHFRCGTGMRQLQCLTTLLTLHWLGAAASAQMIMVCCASEPPPSAA